MEHLYTATILSSEESQGGAIGGESLYGARENTVVRQDVTPHDLSVQNSVDIRQRLSTSNDITDTPLTAECTDNCVIYDMPERMAVFDGEFKDFWESIPSLNDHCIHMKGWNSLEKALREKYGKLSKMTLRGLKKLIGLEVGQHGNGESQFLVKLDDMLNLIKCFGYFVTLDGKCFTLEKLEELLEKSAPKAKGERVSWFAGRIDRDEAERYLENKDEGTFLIRMSCEEFGKFVLSVVPEKKQNPIHILFEFQDSPKGQFIHFYDKEFYSVHSLVKEFKEKAFDPDYPYLLCGRTCDKLPFNTIVTGYKTGHR